MSASALRWLLAYDIHQPRRGRRVHRYLRKRGIACQFSLFVLRADDAAMQGILADLGELIDPDTDRVRAWHVPPHCKVWQLGAQTLTTTMVLDNETLADLRCTGEASTTVAAWLA